MEWIMDDTLMKHILEGSPNFFIIGININVKEFANSKFVLLSSVCMSNAELLFDISCLELN